MNEWNELRITLSFLILSKNENKKYINKESKEKLIFFSCIYSKNRTHNKISSGNNRITAYIYR